MNKDVVKVRCIGGTRLVLTFEGGEEREIDVASTIPFDGVFGALKDETFFRQVRVEPDVGTIVWPNGADICPDALYEESAPTAGTGSTSAQKTIG